MTTNIVPFQFKGNQIRVVTVDGEPWFVAKDIAFALEYADPSKMLNLVDAEDKKTINPQEYAILAESLPSNTFRLSIINESGVYASIFGSTKLEAKVFKRWITSEVIPSIRKTGGYGVPDQAKLPSEVKALNVAKSIAEIQSLIAEDNPRLAQFLIDHAISDIMPSTPLLTGDRLRGVVEIATDMGFKVDARNRGNLGRFVKAVCGDLNQPEKRMVNGITTVVACYPENHPDVKQAISDFFNK